jgi:riboflavin biosynthesis pyrimidine reductase
MTEFQSEWAGPTVRRMLVGAKLRRLRTEHGVGSVLCEGGPQLLGDLLRADLVDELHLVIATKLAGGELPVTSVHSETRSPRCPACAFGSL